MADKLGHYNMMTIMSAFTFILILGLWIPGTSEKAIVAFTVLFGIASGSGISLSPVLVAQISPMQEIGTRSGISFAIAGVASLTGSPIGGAIITATNGSYLGTKIFGGVSSAIGTCFFIASRIAFAGFKGRV